METQRCLCAGGKSTPARASTRNLMPFHHTRTGSTPALTLCNPSLPPPPQVWRLGAGQAVRGFG
eukprot:scaffold12108_cov97-Isochrysis_galbana.AAC.4